VRPLLVLVVLVLAALAVWLAFGRGPEAVVPGPPPPAVERAASTPELARAEVPIEQPAAEPAPRVDAAVPIAQPTTTRARLAVRVVAKGSKKPLARARVGLTLPVAGSQSRDVERTNGELGEHVWTDADGRSTFDVDAGLAFQLTVRGAESLAGHATVDVPALAAAETREVVVELVSDPNLVFFGRVLDAATRAPVAEAAITGEEWNAPTSDRGVTDADGVFRVEMRTWRTAGLRVAARGYGPRWVGPSAGHETADRALEILLERGATLRVELLGADRVPLADAEVRVEAWIAEMASGAQNSHRYLDAMSWTAATGSDGVAVLADLPPGAQLRGSVRRGKTVIRTEADPFVLTAGEDRKLTWILGQGGEIRGVVREQDGTPVPKFEVWLQRATTEGPTYLRPYDESRARRVARTDADGAFRFADVATGGWWVGPRNSGPVRTDPAVEPAPLGEYVVMTGGRVDLDVRLVRGLVIRGRIVGEDGVTPARGQVMVFRPAEQMYIDARPENSETFVVGPLVPGRWTLEANSGADGASSGPVEAEAGATDVVLRLRRNGTVRVRVLDAAGGAVASVPVLAGGAERTSLGNSDAQGVVSFVGIRPGTVYASASAPDGRWAHRAGLAIEPGGVLDVDLLLEQGVRARLRCGTTGKPGRFRVERDGGVLAFVDANAGGTAEFTLPVGRSTLRAFVPGTGFIDRVVDVVAGTTPEFVYDGGWQ